MIEHTFNDNMLNPALLLCESDLISAIVPHPLVLPPATTVIEAIERMSDIRSVCSLPRDTSSFDELYAQARSSCAAIVEDDRLVGILTERDIVRLCTDRRDLRNLTLRDVMATNVVTLKAADFTNIFVAVNLLQQHQIRHLPVIDECDRLVGLLTHETLQRTTRPVDLLKMRQVSEVMTKTVICASPDTSILEIGKLMTQHRVSSVVIFESALDAKQRLLRKPIGIITERDLIQFKALNLNLETHRASTVMSAPVFTVEPTDSLWLVQQILEGQSIQRVVATGEQGELLGIVTQTSLLQALNPVELYNLARVLEVKVSHLETEKIELLQHQTSQLESLVEERAQQIANKVARERLVSKISSQILASLNVTEILDTVVRELQPLLSCDCVSVWELLADGRTLEVVADWHSLATNDLNNNLKGQQISAADLTSEKRVETYVITDIYTTQLSDRLRDLLAGLSIRATILAPILTNTDGVTTIWGFLCAIDSHRIRIWQAEEINLVQQLATQMAIAIQQATAYERLQKLNVELEQRVVKRTAELQKSQQFLQKQADRESVLRQITQKIRQSLDLKTIFETAVWEIRQFMGVDRVAIFKFDPYSEYYNGEFVAESLSGESASILGVKIQDTNYHKKITRFQKENNTAESDFLYTTDFLNCERLVLENFHTRANLILPLLDGTTLWGLLCIHDCAEDYCWLGSEVSFVSQISEQISVGIQQATLYEKIQLELEIRWRAEASIYLQLRQQETLSYISHHIRKSLKIEEILKTAATQIKELMLVDRVSIFRVFTDRKITALEESVSVEYPSLQGRDWSNEYLSQEEFEFYFQGCPHIVIDVNRDWRAMHLQEYIQSICVKSKIVAPILLPSQDSKTYGGDRSRDEFQLWGLLSVHSCGERRYWQDTEAQLLQEIADRLAIAIQQASLFEQLQQELNERQQAEIRTIESNHQLEISNQELARATRLKDEFLASMSHELRTPLNAILGMTESLLEEVFGSLNERQHKSLSTIDKSGKHLLALINDILDLSKIEANKFNLEFADVSIQSLCYNSTVFIKEIAHKRHISLTTQIPDSLKQIKLRVDDLRFRQILINLLSNAVKFTPEGGRITLEVQLIDAPPELAASNGTGGDENQQAAQPIHPSTPTRQIAFAVSDTGIGIAPEHIDKLFQSFVQIDSKLSRQYAGTGLGLSLAKRIAQMHGGTITVRSEVERGSCFTVLLPFVPTLAQILPVATDARTATDQRVQHKGRIAIVEDNEANMETTSSYLNSRGYETIEAISGLQAIELVKIDPPDLILMDIQMPGMDGFEAIERIRQMPECRKIPIVALTALAMPDDRQKCLDAGADRYLSKPVSFSQLVVTINELLVSKPDAADFN